MRSRMNKPTVALLLAGGFGTRLKELTKDIPKPLLLLQGKPIMQYTIDLCTHYGIREFLISVHYQKEKIKAHYGDGSKFGIRIRYIEEDEPLGTGGCLRLAREYLTDTFVMANADELKDIDLAHMYSIHKESNALATDALFHADDPSSYGTVELKENRIVRFVEKPPRGEQPSNWCNAGLYILEPAVIDYVKPGFCMLEKDVFPVLAEKQRMAGYTLEGQWFDTGTPERFARAQKEWNPLVHYLRDRDK